MEPRKLDSKRVLRALAKGVHDAKREHKLAGRPIAVEKDRKVVLIPPEEIELSEPDRC